MKRREFIAGIGGAAAWSMVARGQPIQRVRKIGALMAASENDPESPIRVAAFQKRLQELKWTKDQNVQITYRWGDGDPGRIRAYAAELVSTQPDVIISNAPVALGALQRETRSIPIVFIAVADPVGGGFVLSLARPGGNITGLTNFEFAIGTKWLELIKEVQPNLGRVLVLVNPENPTHPGYVRTIEAAASSVGTRVEIKSALDLAEIQRGIEFFANEGGGGLLLLPDSKWIFQRAAIIELTVRHQLPAIYPFKLFAVDGGLISYGVATSDQFRQAAEYVDRILRGEKPADLPVQAPNKFELALNMKAAKSLGLTIPPTLLARADEVIE